MQETYQDDAVAVEVDDAIEASIDVEAIHAAAAATLRHAGSSAAALTVVLTTDEYVRTLNAQYRGVDAPTDVLSFAAHDARVDAPTLAVAEEAAAEVAAYLGDLIIAYPYAVRQAEQYRNSVTAELQLLAVHGTLHLLGYDHDDATSEQTMWSLQEEVLTEFGHGALARRTYS